MGMLVWLQKRRRDVSVLGATVVSPTASQQFMKQVSIWGIVAED